MNKDQKIDEAMNWWYDISDHQTTELIMKHKLRKPIKEQDILKLFALYSVSNSTPFKCCNDMNMEINTKLPRKLKKKIKTQFRKELKLKNKQQEKDNWSGYMKHYLNQFYF